jgi:hypothetical protein
MANVLGTKLAVTSTENTKLFGTNYQLLHIKNQGSTDCQIDFDQAVSDDSYLLEAGEALTITNYAVIRLHFKTASGTTTLYTLVLK